MLFTLHSFSTDLDRGIGTRPIGQNDGGDKWAAPEKRHAVSPSGLLGGGEGLGGARHGAKLQCAA
jgi:hypothetical protein